MLEFLMGKKTYLVSAAMLCYAAGGWVLGHLDANAASELALQALGLSALRAGVAKVGK